MNTKTLQELVSERAAVVAKQQAQASAWNAAREDREARAVELFRQYMLGQGIALGDQRITATELKVPERNGDLRYRIAIWLDDSNHVRTTFAVMGRGFIAYPSLDHTGMHWWHTHMGDTYITSTRRLDDAVLRLLHPYGCIPVEFPEAAYVEPA